MNEPRTKKYLLLRDTLCQDMLTGKLKPGDRLPSIRELVRRTSLSQTTVEHALALLQDEGLIRTIPQAGCYVTGLEPRQPRLLSTPAASGRDEAAPPDLPEPLWDLQTNAIHPELFDMKLWKRFLRQTLEESRTLASYGDSQGEPALRQALADHLFRLRRLRTDPDSILVGPSYQTLLFMLATLIGKPLTVAMEHHAPALARNAFQCAGWRILELDSDKDGPLPQELTKPFDCLYLTTACAGTKKKALRNRLDLYQDLFVIEDDYNGELTYASGPRNALSARLKHSVYIGSFSRVLLPSLRLSCMVLPKELLSRFDPASYAPMASRIEQLALARYIASGNLEKHIRRLNRIYRRRSDLVMNILRDFPLLLDEAYLCVEIPGYALPAEFACSRSVSGLRLSFASLPDASLETAFQAVRNSLQPVDRAQGTLSGNQIQERTGRRHPVA